ncbi:DUF3048 domain-containing protein [Streptomyces sp. ODS28]|uniref:DUF3048 domain-containing protein n=1 Tax=Streptomyces sp. ODS28 TaxID=3136688 RepID=UPI0031E8F375
MRAHSNGPTGNGDSDPHISGAGAEAGTTEPHASGRPIPRRTAARLLAVLAGAGATGLASLTPAQGAEERGAEEGTRAWTSPLTGLPADPGPVLAVKIDNHEDARPHTALEAADIVGVEKVEGGLSRLFAVYSSHLPRTLGPVRSAREYNVEQMRMFHRPALAYSGAREGVVKLIKKSPLYGVSHDDHPGVYERGGSNEPPHNLYAKPEEVLAKAPKATHARDIGFRFGPKPGGGRATKERTVDYGSARTGFTWSAEEKRWLVSFDGKPAESIAGKRLGGATVIIQETDMPPDSSGETPYIKTVGSGTATVLRDGEAFRVKWQRKGAEEVTTYTRPDGSRMPFARGQVWLVYEQRK